MKNFTKLIIALSVLISLTGCFEAPGFVPTKKGTASLVDKSSESTIGLQDDGSGAFTGTFSNTGDVQVLSVTSGDLDGVKLKIFPGTFAANTTLKIEQGASLANSLQVSSANTGEVTTRSLALVIKPDNKKDPIRPFALTLPISSSLHLDAGENFAVAFKYIKYSENEKVYLGVIPATQLVFKDNQVSFEAPYFGAFQLVSTEKPVTTNVMLKSKEEVVTKAEETAAQPTPTPTATPVNKLSMYYFSTIYLRSSQLTSGITTKIVVDGGSGSYEFSNLSVPASFSPTVSLTSTGQLFVQGGVTPATYSGFSLKVTDSGTGLSKVFDFTLDIQSSQSPCVWRGWFNNAFAEAKNWDFCNGTTPSSDPVSIDRAAVNPLIISSNQTISGFTATPYDGGVVLVAPGATLNIPSDFKSSIGLAGTTDSCTTCVVSLSSTYTNITQGATLTLLPGIAMELPTAGQLTVGGPEILGHLSATGSATYRPVIRGQSGGQIDGIFVRGGSTVGSSSIEINGLDLFDLKDGPMGLAFSDHYEIRQLDSMHFKTYANMGNGSLIKLGDCASGSYLDMLWSDLNFDTVLTATAKNIDATSSSCVPTELPSPHYIKVTSLSGAASASSYQDDPNDVILFDDNN